MTLYGFLLSLYEWAEGMAWAILLASAALPAAGTVAAWIGRGGRTDADGRVIASTVIATGMALLLLEGVGIAIGVSAFNASVLNADVMLLAAGPVAFLGSLMGMRLVFPLAEIGAVRTLVDGAFFALASAGVMWLFSRIRWGVIFIGSFTQLVVITGLGLFFLRRMFLRALGGGRPAPEPRPQAQGWPER